MKRIDELNISPTPWEVSDAVNPTTMPRYMKSVRSADTAVIWMPNCAIQDARLIAAAPELYEALSAFVEFCEWKDMNDDGIDYLVEHAKAVLAKAAGETVTDCNQTKEAN